MISIDLGSHPVCNRFQEKKGLDEYVNPLELIQNRDSGLVKMKRPMPATEMHPRYKWLSETEPEHHFKDVADKIVRLPNIHSKNKIISFSYRDNHLTKELHNQGFENTFSIVNNIENYDPAFVGVAKLQHQLCNLDFINNIKNAYGSYDLLLANRILHHVHDLKTFFLLIDNLLDKNGYAVLEVPDCERGFVDLDYNIIFEEHVSYFTENTLRNVIRLNGFDIVLFKVYPYPFEDALIAIIKKSNMKKVSILPENVTKETNLFTKFSQSFPILKKSIKSFFNDSCTKGSIIFFGAGHHGISFVNIMEIGQYVDCFIDDVKEKHNYYTPGSCLPIHSSNFLTKDNIALCVVSVSQENEEKVIERIRLKSKGNFEIFSIFPASKYALPIY